MAGSAEISIAEPMICVQIEACSCKENSPLVMWQWGACSRRCRTDQRAAKTRRARINESLGEVASCGVRRGTSLAPLHEGPGPSMLIDDPHLCDRRGVCGGSVPDVVLES